MSLDLTQQAAIATILSTVAAFASFGATRAARKAAEMQDFPIINGYYDSNKDGIYLINHGRGPALSIVLQHNTIHYTDIGGMFEFVLADDCIRTLLPDGKPQLLKLHAKSTKDNTSADSAFSAFEYYFALGKNKYIAVIFRDIHNNRFIHYMKAKGDENGRYALDIIKTKRYYRIITPIKDYLETKLYRQSLFKRIRERDAKHDSDT